MSIHGITGHLPSSEKLFALSISAVLALIAFRLLRMVIDEICEFIRYAADLL